MVGGYVGQTAIKTQKVIDQAMGGVLFIDEAYSLLSDDNYSRECISTLIKAMEDHRDKLCVILAGYPQKMEELLKSNSGFESRIAFKIDFSDYKEAELYQIFKNMLKDEGTYKKEIIDNKNSFITMLDEAKYGEFNQILIEDTSIFVKCGVFNIDNRILGFNPMELIEDLRVNKVNVHFMKENLDTIDNSNNMILSILFHTAEFEIVERIKRHKRNQ